MGLMGITTAFPSHQAGAAAVGGRAECPWLLALAPEGLAMTPRAHWEQGIAQTPWRCELGLYLNYLL
jgi:hypothetical protein